MVISDQNILNCSLLFRDVESPGAETSDAKRLIKKSGLSTGNIKKQEWVLAGSVSYPGGKNQEATVYNISTQNWYKIRRTGTLASKHKVFVRTHVPIPDTCLPFSSSVGSADSSTIVESFDETIISGPGASEVVGGDNKTGLPGFGGSGKQNGEEGLLTPKNVAIGGGALVVLIALILFLTKKT